MCRITKNTVRKASERTMSFSRSTYPKTSKGELILSVRYSGGHYHGKISMTQVRKAYGRALEIIEKK